VVLGLGGLAGCALPTEVATPKLGQSLDNVRQEVAQLRTETAQLDALFRVVEDGVWARDAVLVQLDAALAQLGKRLQVLEKDVPLLKRPSGPRGPLLAAGSDSGRPSGHRLQVGMSPDAVRARLGAHYIFDSAHSHRRFGEEILRGLEQTPPTFLVDGWNNAAKERLRAGDPLYGKFRELIEHHYVWIYTAGKFRVYRHQAPGKAAGE